jgi:membrane-bound metal-dependent hydrolase YbcI (DUF457 family)
MKGKFHLGTTLMAMYAMNPTLDMAAIDPYFVLGGVLGSYLPDSDTVHSPAAILPLWAFFQHRTVIHSLFAMGVFTLGAWFISPSMALGLGLGYGLHLFFDNFSKTGLPYLFFPAVYKRAGYGKQ